MAKNKALQLAAKARQDEFYTDIKDVENELAHYTEHFKDKIVLCNCDDPYESAFFKYFAMSFNSLGLKKLITTCYKGSPIAQQFLIFEDDKPQNDRTPYYVEINELEDYNNDGRKDLKDVEWALLNKHNTRKILQGDGDFRSSECIELLKQADIVVTNPPFSLLREYIAQLFKYDKKFLILGNKNAVTYKEIFPLFMQNKMWIGVRNMNQDFWFIVPQDENYEKIDEMGRKVKHIMACWLTNLEHGRHNEIMPLYKKYYDDPEQYPKYDNYDAIEVSKTVNIPCDYDGVMGVPITFLDKYNPKQFEILGLDRYIENNPKPGHRFTLNGKETYARILIRRKGD